MIFFLVQMFFSHNLNREVQFLLYVRNIINNQNLLKMGAIKPNDYNATELNISKLTDALGHPVRTRILEIIKQNPYITQTQLDVLLPLSRNAVYNHLSKLKNAELVIENYNIHYFPLEINWTKVEYLKSFLEELSKDQ